MSLLLPRRGLLTGAAALAASSALAGNYKFSRMGKGGGTVNWVAAMTALAGGNTPWVDSDFQNGRYFDQVHGPTALGAQWVQNLTWAGFTPTTGLIPGSGLTNKYPPNTPSLSSVGPTLVDAVAAPMVGGSQSGPTITVRLQAAGANSYNSAWYMARFDLPDYNQLVAPTVSPTVEAPGPNQNGNGVYASNAGTGFVFQATGVPLNGGHLAAVLYPDGSAKASCGGGTIVNAPALPAPYTPPTNIGLDIIIPAAPGSAVADYFLQRVTFWVGDLSAYLTALSA